MKRIEDFIDYNYVNIAFDISGVGKEDLKHKLLKDNVNHLYELDGANFIAIWNCDLQGFKRRRDIYFDSYSPYYTLAKLVKLGNGWFYDLIDSGARVVEDLQLI